MNLKVNMLLKLQTAQSHLAPKTPFQSEFSSKLRPPDSPTKLSPKWTKARLSEILTHCSNQYHPVMLLLPDKILVWTQTVK